jgi:UDP-GlcNAc:undecaprenyl-phosphate GlcNAc-1-phosphate transferase
VYTVLALGVLTGSRASYRVLYHWNRRSNQGGQPVVIYGAGKGGTLALREMLTNDDVMMKPIGFIDDDPLKRGRFVNGYPVLGDVSMLEEIVAAGNVHGVVIASEKIPIAKVASAKRVCDRNGAWVTYFEVNFRRPLEPDFRRRQV